MLNANEIVTLTECPSQALSLKIVLFLGLVVSLSSARPLLLSEFFLSCSLLSISLVPNQVPAFLFDFMKLLSASL